MKCPDDSTATTTANNVTYVPISYAMNSNAVGTAIAQFAAPSSTVMAFEVQGVYGNPSSSAPDQGGATGNGTPGTVTTGQYASGSTLSPPSGDAGKLAVYTYPGVTSTPKYETGLMTNVSSGTPVVAPYDKVDGLHTGGANYLFADSHVKFARPSAISAGANNSDSTGDGNTCGTPSATYPIAANSSCGTIKAGTFSTQ